MHVVLIFIYMKFEICIRNHQAIEIKQCAGDIVKCKIIYS